METKSVRLRIYGQEYPLRVDNEELTTESAHQLDKMMSELHTQIPDQPPVTLAVLSALNLAEDLSHEREERQQLLRMMEKEVRSISDFLDGVIS